MRADVLHEFQETYLGIYFAVNIPAMEFIMPAIVITIAILIYFNARTRTPSQVIPQHPIARGHILRPVVKRSPVTIYGECPVCGTWGGGESCVDHLGYKSWIEYE
jgi:hypothetical protein